MLHLFLFLPFKPNFMFHTKSGKPATGLLFGFLLFLASLTLQSQPPAGYYSTATGTGATLKTQLYNIIKDHTAVSYDAIWTHFETTDAKANGKVWDVYSNTDYSFSTNQCGEYDNEGDCYNREHSFPASWFADATPMYSDIFAVFPSDGFVNNKRSNYPFAEVGTATYTSTNGSKLGNCITSGYGGTVFEPADEYKGDFARMLFYMATRYENVIAGWYANSSEANVILQNNSFPVYEAWYLDMLGQWHVDDPVSEKETNRNEAIYGIQGNRNPFVDNPAYVYQVWGVGQGLAEEPASHATNFSAHTIVLQWTDAGGATLPDGYLIRMSSTGFEAISAPVDGTPIADDLNNKNIAYGVEQAVFGMLSPGQEYFFKIFPYKGSGTGIDYKTDGSVQQVSLVAN